MKEIMIVLILLFCMAWILETTLRNLTKIPRYLRRKHKRKEKSTVRICKNCCYCRFFLPGKEIECWRFPHHKRYKLNYTCGEFSI